MTEKEMQERLKAAGIDPGAWAEMGGGTPKSPHFILRQAKNLQQLKGLLEGIVEQKQGEVRVLEEKLARLKYGGGS